METMKELKEKEEHKNKVHSIKVQFETKKPMSQILKENNKKICEGNLTEEQIYALKIKNLLSIQDLFFKVMEQNPLLFRIPHLLYHRKKILKEKQFQGEVSTQKKMDKSLIFSSNLSKAAIIKRTKLVKKKMIFL